MPINPYNWPGRWWNISFVQREVKWLGSTHTETWQQKLKTWFGGSTPRLEYLKPKFKSVHEALTWCLTPTKCWGNKNRMNEWTNRLNNIHICNWVLLTSANQVQKGSCIVLTSWDVAGEAHILHWSTGFEIWLCSQSQVHTNVHIMGEGEAAGGSSSA